MTDHHHPESQVPERDRPTPRQLRLLRSLALQTGQSFATPRTKTQASQEIRRLQRASRRGERQTPTTSDVSDRLPNAAAYRNHEITGYGITARWA